MSNLDKFTKSYLECALWSSTDNSTEEGGEPLDNNYSIEDFDDVTMSKMIEDCRQFQQSHSSDFASHCKSNFSPEENAGHNFWLTRNGHGAGFWDGDYPEDIGEKLTETSKKFGAFDLYVADGKVYGS